MSQNAEEAQDGLSLISDTLKEHAVYKGLHGELSSRAD